MEPQLTRRNVLTAGAIAAGYALAVRPVAASAITTDADGLVEGSISIPVGKQAIRGYRAHPAKGGPFPVVLVVHEIFGVHAYIQDVCRRLAKHGYLAIAPELYQRQGDPAQAADFGALIRDIVAKVPDAQVMADLDAAAVWAAQSGEGDLDRLAITGFCWGGRIVWMYSAHSARVKAGVAWYGRLASDVRPETPTHPLDVVGKLGAPVLGLYAGRDRAISASDIEKMNAALATRNDGSEIIVYPASSHGFHADYRPSYDADAAQDGWKRLLAWLSAHGV